MSDFSEEPQSVSSQRQKPSKTITFRPAHLLVILIIIVVGVAGFFLGETYQKHHEPKSDLTSSNFARGNFGGGFGGSGGGLGTVSAISSSSITVDTRSGSSKTYAITSSTTITDNGQSASASSIQTGDRVIVTPSSSNSSDAARIIVNPSFGGGFGGSAQGSSTDSNTGGSNSATTQ